MKFLEALADFVFTTVLFVVVAYVVATVLTAKGCV